MPLTQSLRAFFASGWLSPFGAFFGGGGGERERERDAERGERERLFEGNCTVESILKIEKFLEI